MTPSAVPVSTSAPETETAPASQKKQSSENKAPPIPANQTMLATPLHVKSKGRLSLRGLSNVSTENISCTVSNEIQSQKSSNLANQSYEKGTEDSNFIELSRKFNIKLAVAKKYHLILTNCPQIPVVKMTNVKEEIVSPASSPTRSPVVGGKKKVTHKRLSGTVKVKRETGVSGKVVRKPLHISNRLEQCFDSRNVNIKQEPPSPLNSRNNDFYSNNHNASKSSTVKNPLAKKRIVVDSDDEFENPMPDQFRKCNNVPDTITKNATSSIRLNPVAFHKKRQALKNQHPHFRIIPKISKTASRKTEDLKDQVKISSKLIKLDRKIVCNGKSENGVSDDNHSDREVSMVHKTRINLEHDEIQMSKSKRMSNDASKTTNKYSKSRVEKLSVTNNKNKVSPTKSISSNDLCSSVDSITVNYPAHMSKKKKIRDKTVESDNDSTKKKLLSFGAGSSNEEKIFIKSAKKSSQTNTDDNNSNKTQPLHREFGSDNERKESKKKKLKSCPSDHHVTFKSDVEKSIHNQTNTLNDSSLMTRKQTMGKSPLFRSLSEKPLIKINTLSTRKTIKLPSFKKKTHHTVNSRTPSNDIGKRSIFLISPSPKDKLVNSTTHTNFQTTGSPTSLLPVTSEDSSPPIGGTTINVGQERLILNQTLNFETPDKQNAESSEFNHGQDGDESFEDLCRDVNMMSESENITLYKSYDNNNLAPPMNGNDKDQQNLQSVIRDPRLTRSISPQKNLTSVSRDPRLNRSMNSTAEAPTVSTSSAVPEKSDPDLSDSNVRKRKFDEESEPSAKVAKPSEPDENNQVLTTEPCTLMPTTPRRLSVHERLGPMASDRANQIEDLFNRAKSQDPDKDNQSASSQLCNSTPTTPRRVSIHERLGPKTPDQSHLNECASIIKNALHHERKTISYDSEEEGISLHPDADDLIYEEEDIESSPRHGKFETERKSIEEELAYTPVEDRRRRYNRDQPNQRRNIPPPGMATNWIPPREKHTAGNQERSLHAPTMNTRKAEPVAGGTTFNNFVTMNEMQMMRDEANFQMQQFYTDEYVTFGNNGMINGQFDNVSMLHMNTKPASMVNLANQRSTFFSQYCFSSLRVGNCRKESTCNYKHGLNHLYNMIKHKTTELLFHLIDFALTQDFEYFLKHAWVLMLPQLKDQCFTAFQKYYEKRMITDKIIDELLNFCLSTKLHTVESFVKQISTIIKVNDTETVHKICAVVKGKLSEGFCWEAIKDLCQKAVPPRDMIELTILQCLTRKKNLCHIKEVYELVHNKLSNTERKKISPDMLNKFYDLANKQVVGLNTKEVLNTVPLMSNGNTPNLPPKKNPLEGTENLKPSQATIEARIARFSSGSRQQPNNSPLEEGDRPRSGENIGNAEYFLKEVEANDPGSVWRKKYWKLYNTVNNIQAGLSHADYSYVFKMLNDFVLMEKFDNHLYQRAVYQILCSNVLACERHVAGVIRHAVHSSSMSSNMISILFEVGLLALADLAKNTLWVMAHQLLSSVKTIEPLEPRTDYVLICAEIYLANDDPLEALYLLRKTQLIRTNRDEWLVKGSTKDHEKHRNKVVLLLLRALSYKDQEKAVYLFQAILKDQYISYYPIDLPLWVDKLSLILLYFKKYDLAIEISRLVMDNDLTFHKSTYKELITHLLSVDEVLAHQLLEYATRIGHYSDIQIKNGFTLLIIDVNYTEEELYLVVKRLINRLSLNLGPVIERLTPNQLKVVLMFEDIPNSKRLCKNEISELKQGVAFKMMKSKIKVLLATQFRPAMRISACKIDKGIRIVSRTLVKYLQNENTTM
ncbi:uncharacterized protein LOC106640482 [Copidosoma floridanum]|uniref:uncharacterized protein LOC106640482 n=1 Tax=Copidosoma floridanum TaxID=29053 RepID=UPI0006C942A2|nr:uncharacterized protein LOC106640482 [Copidosoma floridanum]